MASRRPELVVRRVLRQMLRGERDPEKLAKAGGLPLERFTRWTREHRVWEQYYAFTRIKRLRAELLAGEHLEIAVAGLLSLAGQDKAALGPGEQETMRKACVDLLRIDLQKHHPIEWEDEDDLGAMAGEQYIPRLSGYARRILDELGGMEEVEEDE